MLPAVVGFSQKEANTWYFGYNAGLDFNSIIPTPLSNSAMQTHGGSAVVSDPKTGELLFYSNGERIWNKNHEVMLNGDDLLGSNTSDQCALIIPLPGSNKKFYLFTIKAVYKEGIAAEMYYTIIDMDLANGLGAVTIKNELLVSNIIESQTAVKQKESDNYWLVAHKANSNTFLAYEISPDGIGTPTESAIGSIYYSGQSSSDSELKLSPNGSMLAAGQGTTEPTPIELFDFNSSNGTLSNYRQLTNLSSHYGLSFSPDNLKLYASGTNLQYLELSGDIGDYIYQFDLSNPDEESIRNSRVPIFSERNVVTNLGKHASALAVGMQIGPDGKIYAAGNITIKDGTGSLTKTTRNALIVIERPNEKGFNCYASLHFFNFGNGSVFPGLPNFPQHIFNLRTPVEGEISCSDPGAYVVFPNPAREKFNIKVDLDCFNPYFYTLYNSLGQSVREGFVFSRESDLIDVQSLSTGMYFLVLKIPNLTIKKKILILNP